MLLHLCNNLIIMNKSITFSKVIKAGFLAGLISAAINTIWNQLGIFVMNISGLPKGFSVAVVMSSILPVLFASIIYFLLIRNFTRGYLLYMFLGVSFMLLSNFPAFEVTLPDGTPTPANFALLVIPMHFVAGLSALYLIPLKTRNTNKTNTEI